jgi:hypothetical protein
MGATLEAIVEDIAKAARNGLTTSVGLGVLVYQRAQVHRQELIRLLPTISAGLHCGNPGVDGNKT